MNEVQLHNSAKIRALQKLLKCRFEELEARVRNLQKKGNKKVLEQVKEILEQSKEKE